MESSFFDFTGFIRFCLKHKKVLITLTLLSTIISSIMSFMIEEKYESTVIMFPPSTNSISKALLSEIPIKSQDIMQFGEDEHVEQLLQLLKSDYIAEKIIDRYNLLNHYEIDENDKEKYTKLYKKFNSNITFNRTELMSVRIRVLDKDPDTAQLIANDIAMYVDTVKTMVQRQRTVAGLEIVEKEYKKLANYIAKMEDSLKVLRKLGIHDYESQSEVLTEQYAVAINKNNTKAIKILEEKLDVLAEYGGSYLTISKMLKLERKRLDIMKRKYTEAKIDAEADIPQKFIVNSANKPESKAYPIRWLIVFVSVISTFILSVISISVIEKL